MEALISVLMIVICFNFMLKQTYRKLRSVIIIAVVAALFTGLMQPYAIEQSKSQIAEWLADTRLMLDISVILTIEVVIQMAFCMTAAHVMTAGQLRRRTIRMYRLLRWFPGVLIFPVLFYALVTLIFALPGVSFSLIAWGLAAAALLLIPAGSWLIRWLLPEKDLRLEILFLTNALTAILGIIATVNGRTAVAGVSNIDRSALAAITILIVLGTIAGVGMYKLKIRNLKLRTKN